MKTILMYILASILLFTPIFNLIKYFNFKQQILKIGPKWHSNKKNTPMMGGILFIVSIIIYIIFNNRNIYIYKFSIYCICFGLIGFIDDYMKTFYKQNLGLSSSNKFFLQSSLYCFIINNIQLTKLVGYDLFFPIINIYISLYWILFIFLSYILIIGITNAVNLTDGIDGLVSIITLIILLSFLIFIKNITLLNIILILISNLIIFICFNCYPAKIFMGDSGSLFLGSILILICFYEQNPLLSFFIGIIFIIEALSCIIQIIYFKLFGSKRLFKMAPLHHHYELLGWSEFKIVCIFAFITLLFICFYYLNL